MSNILLITYGFPPDVGGAELVAYDYATNLAKLGKVNLFNLIILKSWRFQIYLEKNYGC